MRKANRESKQVCELGLIRTELQTLNKEPTFRLPDLLLITVVGGSLPVGFRKAARSLGLSSGSAAAAGATRPFAYHPLDSREGAGGSLTNLSTPSGNSSSFQFPIKEQVFQFKSQALS